MQNERGRKMISRKGLLFFVVFAAGFVAAGAFSLSSSWAQFSGFKGFSEDVMSPSVPKSYGSLVGISDLKMYFQGEDGTIYIVKQRTSTELDSSVRVIKRGE